MIGIEMSEWLLEIARDKVLNLHEFLATVRIVSLQYRLVDEIHQTVQHPDGQTNRQADLQRDKQTDIPSA